jgi:hypothetical protein
VFGETREVSGAVAEDQHGGSWTPGSYQSEQNSSGGHGICCVP